MLDPGHVALHRVQGVELDKADLAPKRLLVALLLLLRGYSLSGRGPLHNKDFSDIRVYINCFLIWG